MLNLFLKKIFFSSKAHSKFSFVLQSAVNNEHFIKLNQSPGLQSMETKKKKAKAKTETLFNTIRHSQRNQFPSFKKKTQNKKSHDKQNPEMTLQNLKPWN